MPMVTVEGETPFEVEIGTKLVLALEDNGYDILHRCGGMARCTTCRVEIVTGEVEPISEAEEDALEGVENADIYRLSCQIKVQHDLTLRIGKRASTEGVAPGPRPRP